MNYLKSTLTERWLIKSSPSKRLSTTLKKFNKQQLFNRLLVLGIPFDEKAKKDELAAILMEHLLVSDQITDLLTWATEEECHFLKSFSNENPQAFTESNLKISEYLLDSGLLHLFESKDDIVLSAQSEILDSLNSLNIESNLILNTLKNEVTQFLKASTTLYGVMPLNTTYQMYEAYFPGKLSEDDFKEIAYASQVRNENYWIENDLLYNNFFVHEETFKGLIQDILKTSFSYYHPEYTEFIAYANQPLNEQTEAFSKLLKILSNSTKQPSDAYIQDMMYLLEFIPLDGFMKYINELGITFKSNSELKQVTELYLKVKNKTRSWLCRGFTFEEITKVKPETVRVHKIGRNEKCPCESGKKYKHCCGTN